jgi:trigger factor
MSILQEALEKIVEKAYFEAISKEKIEVVGMPEIKVEKAAPGNDVVFKATVATLPNVKIADLEKIEIKKDVKEVTDKEIEETLENLTKMQAKEIIKNDKAVGDDKVVIDMDLFVDNIPIEGGQAKDYQVSLAEKDHHIPGFNDNLIGLKKDDEKEFELDFPENYHSKNLAGKKGKFKIKVKEVYKRELAKIDDAFAKALGQESLAKLKELLKENLSKEKEQKAGQSAEIEMFDLLIEKSSFDEIPEVLVNNERNRMFYELQTDLEKNGISIEQYMKDIKKDEKELQNHFTEKATKRAKASLLSRQIALQNKIEIDEKDLQKEIKLMEETYKTNPEYLENLKKPEVKESIKNMLINKKVVEFLKDKIIK